MFRFQIAWRRNVRSVLIVIWEFAAVIEKRVTGNMSYVVVVETLREITDCQNASSASLWSIFCHAQSVPVQGQRPWRRWFSHFGVFSDALPI